MLRTTFLLLAIAYVPGVIVFRLPFADRSRRAALPPEERLFWAVIISVVISTTGAFALAAAGIYSIAVLATLNILVTALLALAALGDLRLGSAAAPIGWTAAIPALLVAIGVWTYFATPAAEYLLGGRDPGVYMNQGIQIAQQGSLTTTDRAVRELAASERDVFFPPSENRIYYGLRFMGFHLRDPERASVSGQFPQGYPVWIAMAYGLDGVSGSRRVTAWWAILGVVAVYFAAARLVGPFPAAATAVLLAVHVIQTWHARNPNSEIVTQALLFAALLAHAYAHQDGDRFFGPLAATLLGLALFTRLPVVVAIAAAVIASALGRVDGRKPPAGFVITLAAWLAAAGMYYMTQLRPYFDRPLEYWQLLQPVHRLAFAAVGIGVLGLMWAIGKPAVASVVRRWLPIGLVAAVVIGTIYAYAFREPIGRLAPQDAHALRMFVQLYLTPLALALGLLGYAVLVGRSFWRAPAMILTATTFFFLFFYKIRIIPEHFWLTRRFVDIILPAALMFAAAGALLPLSRFTSAAWASKRRPEVLRYTAGTLAVLFLARAYVEAAERVRFHVEYAGLIPKLEQLAERFADDDLVLVEAREASDVHTLGLPLAYVYARNVLVLPTSRPDKPAIVRFLSWADDKYKNIYFIAGGGTDLLSRGVGSRVVASERFQVPEYERTPYDVYPRASLRKPFDFTIYQLVRGDRQAAPSTLDLGGADDLYLVDFYPKERLGSGPLTFRWTQGVSHLLMDVGAESRQVILTLQSGRPQGLGSPRVTVYLGGRELGTVVAGSGFREYPFPIPDDLAATLASQDGPDDIRIESTTWIPRDTGGGADNRALGVMVDSAQIR